MCHRCVEVQSRTEYLGHVKSCLWLVEVAVHMMRWSTSTWTALFGGDELAEVFDLDVDFLNC